MMNLSMYARYLGGTGKIEYPGGKCYLYRVYLKDKKGSPYTLDQPEKFLSARAIERRNRQKIKIDSTDIPVSPVYKKVFAEKELEIVGQSKWNNTVLLRLRNTKALKAITLLPFVKDVRKVFESPDSIKEKTRSRVLSKYRNLEGDFGEYGTAENQIDAMNGLYLHQNGYKGDGMYIAVLDGGFMNTDKIPVLHDVKIAGIKDFVIPNSENVFKEMDHGTMVLSTMAVNRPSYYVGTAPNATYVLARCEDEQTESMAEEDYWIGAVEYADSMGVDVINSSLGYHAFDDSSMNYKYAQQDGEQAMISHTASMLAGKGIVLVNSAGNDGMGTWKKINFPADAKDILTVGAVNDKGVNAPFSAVGPTADGRIKPDVMAYGSPTSVISGHGTIVNDMGTSFSSPLIAGMVACLWEALPNLTAYQIIDLVKNAGNRVDRPDNVYGYGIPDFWLAYKNGKQLNK